MPLVEISLSASKGEKPPVCGAVEDKCGALGPDPGPWHARQPGQVP